MNTKIRRTVLTIVQSSQHSMTSATIHQEAEQLSGWKLCRRTVQCDISGAWIGGLRHRVWAELLVWHVEHDVLAAHNLVGGTDRTIIVGDFNAAPWSTRLRELRSTTASIQVGPQAFATWPSSLGILGVPIDLVVHTRGVTAGRPQIIEVAGSDHKALLVGFRVD